MNKPTRCLTRHQMIAPNAGEGTPRTLTSDDYPLIEIVHEPALRGYWLYLHTAPDVPASLARFMVDGESLVLTCSQLLSSHYCRVTPPPHEIQSRHPIRVYTAGDHLAR